MRVRTMCALLSGVEKQHTPILDTLSSAAEAEIIQPKFTPNSPDAARLGKWGCPGSGTQKKRWKLKCSNSPKLPQIV